MSTTVVSYVLNNGPRPVAPETRARVLAAMEQLGYRPDVGARALRQRRQQVLGLVVPDMSNPFYAEVAREIELAARARGYALVVCNALRDRQTERTHLDVLLEHRVAGVLMTGSVLDPGTWEELAHRGVPLVFVNCGRRPGFATVMSGGGAYVEQLVRHLIEAHGHRQIAYVGRAGPGSTRYGGYLAALEAGGIRHQPEWVVPDGNDPAAGRRGLARLLERLPHGERPTAVVAYNDLVAIGVMRGAVERGLRLPHDLAVVGYDGIPLGAFLTPSLTTVAQDVHALAAASLDALPLPARTSSNGRGAVEQADGTSEAHRAARPADAAAGHAGGAGDGGGPAAAVEAQTATGGAHMVVPAQVVLRESCGCAATPPGRSRDSSC